ncbi:MAG: hypothetical protein J5527_00915 [Treponema sp.]|nr:hypothetical protein [Treponema sp.]
MLKRKLGLLVAAAVMVGMFTSCLNVNVNKEGENSNGNGNGSGIDYTDYDSNFALIVKNNTSKKMVVFKGEPENGQILGGVEGGSTKHFKKNASIFTSSTDYIAYVVTEEDYKEYYESNPKALATSPYTTFYAVFNDNTVNEAVYEISNSLQGKYKLILNNGSKYNVELRNKSPDYGEVLAFSLANTYETQYKMDEGEYMIFPVFRKYDRVSKEIISTYPTYSAGELAGEAKSYEFSLDSKTTERQFNAKTWAEGINFTPSAAYIKIQNNADQGMQFFLSAGSTPMITSAGGKRINDGTSLTFSITMEKLTNNKYEDSKVVAGYRLATNRIDNIYLNGSSDASVTYKAGYLYTYTVTGDPEKGYKVVPLTNEDGTLKEQEVDWSAL